MTSIKGPGAPETFDGSDLRIAIVHARWNTKIIESLVAGAKKSLFAAGVKEENITVQTVPGSYELPIGVQRLYAASQVQASQTGEGPSATDLLSGSTSDLSKTATSPATTPKKPFDAIIAIGVLIKGATMHFEYIADAVSHGLMRVQLDSGVPVIFGLLTVLTEEQGLERAGLGNGGMHNHGEDWGSAAVELGVKRRDWSEGKIL
ncbi:6,7-dimethyl-8-ribityllumazine synthase [Penicillium ucsense]|uniref:6,7-dimethyl-8-ribityllumazine synthase n=2 Tax=Penicillium TaxID=5073 RepID=A0A8J8VWQ5_9EURO|nr:6-7-dimethyl-8-ribityllumazine synthase [Penicillium diatomitis]KAF7712707.1 6,7-dimethyl-8-ribityllumazine synthase [Penicillium ucsense]KAF7735372.1 6,7-dimethyl-8-ribityllumazine synthase [Penicillium ucsense]KAJ5477265.1 6-7-dimethyl-8-ribityllumazine synthase [Penicillium diatomitis]